MAQRIVSVLDSIVAQLRMHELKLSTNRLQRSENDCNLAKRWTHASDDVRGFEGALTRAMTRPMRGMALRHVRMMLFPKSKRAWLSARLCFALHITRYTRVTLA